MTLLGSVKTLPEMPVLLKQAGSLTYRKFTLEIFYIIKKLITEEKSGVIQWITQQARMNTHLCNFHTSFFKCQFLCPFLHYFILNSLDMCPFYIHIFWYKKSILKGEFYDTNL